jgi:hypothetical protein
VEFADQYLIKVESSENKKHPWSGKPENEAEKTFAKTYPAIHGFFEDMRKALIKRYDQGKYFWELRSCSYWAEFDEPKVIVPAIQDKVNYAPDTAGFYSNDKTSIFIPTSVTFALAIVNSQVSGWVTRQTFASKQGGFYEFKPMYVSTLPIPLATPDQQRWCERLAEALIWLNGKGAVHRPKSGDRDLATLPSDNAPHGLMIAFFEQWLNGLVYELFFPGELHARKLKLFDETAKMNPPDLAKLPDSRKPAALQKVFTKAYDTNTTLRGMLFDLRSLDVVRVIEDINGSKTEPLMKGEA